MELTPRLQAIARKVPEGARLVDVGTDHGYLPVWLLLNGKIDRAIAADLREGPLDRARETAQRYGQTERVTFLLCDGLAGVRPEMVDTVVIAGMGGETISAILEAAPWTQRDILLLLQPMTGAPKLREWMQTHGYAILNEEIVREGRKLYSVWTVRGGTMPPLSPAELWTGKAGSDPLWPGYLDMMIEKAEKALHGHLAARAPDEDAITRLRSVIEGARKMREGSD